MKRLHIDECWRGAWNWFFERSLRLMRVHRPELLASTLDATHHRYGVDTVHSLPERLVHALLGEPYPVNPRKTSFPRDSTPAFRKAPQAVLLAMGRDDVPARLELGRTGEVHATFPDGGFPTLGEEERVMRGIADQLGGTLRTSPLWALARRPVTAHSHGGCALGDVTDQWGEVCGHQNLFINDGSLLPRPVGVNPSSTIAAIAERNIEHFVTRLKGNLQPAWQRDIQNAEDWRKKQLDVSLEPPNPVLPITLHHDGVGFAFIEEMRGRMVRLAEREPSQQLGRKRYCRVSYMRVNLVVSVAALTSVLIGSAGTASPHGATKKPTNDGAIDRSTAIARARVWERTDIPSMDLMAGPTDAKSFAFDETIDCSYVDRKMTGRTPKFTCAMDDHDELKVKMGGDNGEVYGEVAATRLLWALGFGADHMYSVRVVCHECPKKLNGVMGDGKSTFDPAAVERKLSGATYIPEGWSWKELDQVDEHLGGATRAERDALKLLAVFIQHSDSKAEQQRLICLGESKKEVQDTSRKKIACERPFMYLNDVGVTFGRANRWNNGDVGSMNLTMWSTTPVWKDAADCVGNLPKSLTGTLDNPVISEGGRQFLANLLSQLSDHQLHDMFAAARVELRLRNPKDVLSGFATVDEWVGAFKTKRDQVVNAHCFAS